MDTSGALPAKDHLCTCYGTETDIRIQSSCTICSQISGLSFDMGCPSRMEASSSPCHQRCLRLRSYKMWWMRAVKHQLYGVCQGPPHNHHKGVESLEPLGRVNTRTGALITAKGKKKNIRWWLVLAGFLIKYQSTVLVAGCFLLEDQVWQQTISKESHWVIILSVNQYAWCLMKLLLSKANKDWTELRSTEVESRWTKLNQNTKNKKNTNCYIFVLLNFCLLE